jgi:hypothetical protein
MENDIVGIYTTAIGPISCSTHITIILKQITVFWDVPINP